MAISDQSGGGQGGAGTSGALAVTWVLSTDLVAVSRGRALVDYDPAATGQPTVGWVPADVALDAFGGLVDNPWGPVGDLFLRPAPATFVEIDPAPERLPPYRFVLADCTDLDGRPWEGCTRSILDRAARELEDELGLRLLAGFEHEFALLRPNPPTPFSVDAARRAEPLLTGIIGAMAAAGVEPVNILPEFGHHQIEVTGAPAIGVAAGDRAIIVREIVREVARALGEPITFAPVIGPDAGTSGAHVHFSLLDTDDQPVGGDPRHPSGLSESARLFTAGVLAHLPALTAITAPSVASYLRLQPRSWAAAYTAFGVANREAAIRVAPGPSRNGRRDPRAVNLELRVADATSNPHLVLAAVIAAGRDGLRRRLELPPSLDVDPDQLSADERAARGIARLPTSLDEASEALAADPVIQSIFGPDLTACWSSLRRSEADRFRSAVPAEIIDAYLRAY